MERVRAANRRALGLVSDMDDGIDGMGDGWAADPWMIDGDELEPIDSAVDDADDGRPAPIILDRNAQPKQRPRPQSPRADRDLAERENEEGAPMPTWVKVAIAGGVAFGLWKLWERYA